MDFLSSMLCPEASSYADHFDNPAVLDFPLPFEAEKEAIGNTKQQQPDEKHPYPASISIQFNEESSGNTIHERRSPTTSPEDRGNKSTQKGEREQNSPVRNKNADVTKDGRASELQKYYEKGQKQFLCNHLAEAVDSYKKAIRAGLEEMAHRKEMMDRMMTQHRDKDIFTVESGEIVAQVHLDLAFVLEVAGKYAESAVELNNCRGMLLNTCHKKRDNRLRDCKTNIDRMERAVAVKDERKKEQSKMDLALKKVEECTNQDEKDAARQKAIVSIKQLLRVERDSLGEQSYVVAKLKLKIAKLRCDGNDFEGALQDADAAIKTLRNVLGEKHTLFGAACLFAATVNEKLVSILSSTESTDPKPISTGMSPECRSKIKKALELFAEAVEPLKQKFKAVHRGEKTKVQTELGDVFHRIGRLYGKEGSYMSAVDAYQKSLEAYCATTFGKTAKKKDFCPDAVTVWQNMAELHLIMNKNDDAVYAAEKCIELARMISNLSSSDCVVTMPILSFEIAGDAYSAMKRHDDATRSYHEALREFKTAQSNTRLKKSFTLWDEAKILKKIGNSLLSEDKTSEAKTILLEALKCLRSGKKGVDSPELPMLLSNIGNAHIRCGEYTEAMKVLRSCLKCYSDNGVSVRSPEVRTAKQLYKEACRGPNHHLHSPNPGSPMTPSPQRTVSTHSTDPLTSYGSTMSSGVCSGATLNSVHGQLQSVLEQLQLIAVNTHSPMSIENSHLSPGSPHRLRKASKIAPSELREMEHDTYDEIKQIESLKEVFQTRVQPATSELDRGSKSDEHIIAKLETELKSIRNELKASESSYQHMLHVIDETKENMRITHEIETKSLEEEIMNLHQQQKKSSEEVALLKATNRTLQAENDAYLSEIVSLNAAIDKLQSKLHHSSNGSVAERKNLEYELKQERSRRMILEATIEKEYETRGGGSFAYHPMMPFGYPMHVGPDKNLKTLEIDLATERANKEMLEGIVKDLTATHEREVNELTAQLRDRPNLVTQIEVNEKQNAMLSEELGKIKLERESVQKQLDDVLKELSDVKGRFLEISGELSTLMEEKNTLIDELSRIHAVESADATENDNLRVERDCLKKEFKEAVSLFESEIDRINRDQAEVFLTQKKELDDTRLHLKNILMDLDDAEENRDRFQVEVQKLEKVLDSTRHELEGNKEELRQALKEVESLRISYEEANSARSEFESSLRTAEKTIKDIDVERTGLKSSLSTVIEETQTSKKQLKSTLLVLKNILACLDVEVEDSLNDDDNALLQIICGNIVNIVEQKKKELQVSEYNLSNTVCELDILEKKHRQLKNELTEFSDLKVKHTELLQECKQLSKDLVEANIQREEAQERCNLHKSRLKDAVDDLDELENERNELQVELDRAFEDSEKLERSLRDMISTLEDENERLRQYESATVEFDATVWEKDQKIKRMTEELQSAHSQLKILWASATSKSKENEEEMWPDILPETRDAIKKIASLTSSVHSLEERNFELSEKLSALEKHGDTDFRNEETRYISSIEVEAQKSRVNELSERNENLEQELSKNLRDEVEMQRKSENEFKMLNEQVNEPAQQLQESQEEVMKAASIHDDDVNAITLLQDVLNDKEKRYTAELDILREQVASLSVNDSALEDRRIITSHISESKEMKQSGMSSEDVFSDILSLKAQARELEHENKNLSALLAEARSHGEEIIFELKTALAEKNELLQRINQGIPAHKDGDFKKQERECDECQKCNQELANVMNLMNDLEIENQGLKTELLLWETSNNGKGVGDKINFEKEMNASHKRFVSMEKSLKECIKRLEKEKEKLVAAHNDEMSRKVEQHDKTRIELSAWKLEMQNALNDIESLKRENADLRRNFDAVVSRYKGKEVEEFVSI